MNLINDDIILKCQMGAPIPFGDICFIYPPTLRDIVNLGYSKFLQYIQLLTITKPNLTNTKENKEIIGLLNEITDFQYFLIMVSQDKDILNTAKESFLFFTKEKPFFLIDSAQIILGPIQEKHLILEENFYNFQSIIKKINFINIEEEDIIFNENDSPRVKALKMQMLKNRKAVAEAKRKKEENNKTSLEFSDIVASAAINIPDLNILNIWDLT